MLKSNFFLLVIVALGCTKPEAAGAPLAYAGLPVASPLIYSAPGFVTATSAQYVARNHNAVFAAPYVAAAAPLIASASYSYAPAFI